MNSWSWWPQSSVDQWHSSILDDFNFLVKEYGFQLNRNSPSSIIYKKNNLGVFIDLSGREYISNVTLGLFWDVYPDVFVGQWSLDEIVEFKFKKYGNLSDVLRKLNLNIKLKDQLKEDAKLFKECAGDILAGDMNVLEQLRRFREEESLLRWEWRIGTHFEWVIKRALLEFEERDFEAVVFYLHEYEKTLSPQELVLFKYAEKQMKVRSKETSLTQEELKLLNNVKQHLN